MTTEWKGKSRGTVLGYRIFVFSMKKFGLGVAYFILCFVAFYYCLFARENSRSIYYYFRKRLKYSKFGSLVSIYRSYYVFGQTIIDKVAISSGMRDRFTYEFDGIENIQDTLKQKKGGVLLSAHVGNFEISEHFFGDLKEKTSISLLTNDIEHTAIREYLDSVTRKSDINFILIREDLSHIFEINAALARNEIVCITGDRFVKGAKYVTCDFIGKEARFPAGPFLLASRLNVPVLFVFVMREKGRHYHLYARKAKAGKRDSEALLKEYAESVARILEKYPLQWFNYFDFWGTGNK
ncbi:lipid A biosynthesis acyltransferase [Sinomicrobium kalidii]|uniref:LpxL/LpxP family acyltransferase n=1 Tax=Sinomicrobium kalidii TaxID=2900738 RepID=UPI001E59E2FF|nr:lipid A biosynthesis acyltransferase [Sinomicrobium kalidii]UGU15800.1 lipid A biosynthesis acyltransferase [Sinomicrobium kalidii]